MPIGQNLQALMSAEMPRDRFAGLTSVKADSAGIEGLGGFSSILAAQQPAELKALLGQLSQVQGQTAESNEELSSFAADGNSLPVEIKEWLQKLAMLESPLQDTSADAAGSIESTESSDVDAQEAMGLLAGLSSQWQQWMAQLPETAGLASGASAPTAASAAINTADADKALKQIIGTELSAGLPGDKVLPGAQGAMSLPEMLAQLRAAMSGSAPTDADAATNKTAAGDESAAKGKVQQGDADDRLMAGNRQANPADQPQQSQRVANLAASADSQGLFAAKLAEHKGGDSAKLESSAVDALENKAATTVSAAQNALTQRPVASAAQPVAVPFGQAGWSESVVNKVMWMSSQNLRSVEIQLDPAELGPLEIKIQARGLEHQVQFVSQNPAVRDALEAQMHRLRELFAQQGVDQLDVSVSDGSSGQQSGSEARGNFAGGESGGGRAGGSALAGTSQVGSEDELPMAAAQSMVANSRLVDYYA
tara:strand:+ start:9071 stop:10510 length:1440 start_codon:yes stop_codon:yes gene_type:complete